MVMSPCLLQQNLAHFRVSLPLDMLSNLIMQIQYMTHQQKKYIQVIKCKTSILFKKELDTQ